MGKLKDDLVSNCPNINIIFEININQMLKCITFNKLKKGYI